MQRRELERGRGPQCRIIKRQHNVCKEELFLYIRLQLKHWLPRTQMTSSQTVPMLVLNVMNSKPVLGFGKSWTGIGICATLYAYCLCLVHSTLLYLWCVKKEKKMMCFRLCKFYILVCIIHAFSEYSSLLFNIPAATLLTSILLFLQIMRVFSNQLSLWYLLLLLLYRAAVSTQTVNALLP